jgi:micrococcal nuclease
MNLSKNNLTKIITVVFFVLLSFLAKSIFVETNEEKQEEMVTEAGQSASLTGREAHSHKKTIESVKEGTVKFVIDGATFVLENEERVRLLGIDSPERGEPFYEESKERLKTLTEGKKVILKKDVSEKDKYGRSLRHIYIDNNWINRQMIEEGWARLITIPPDTFHVKEFKKAQLDAQKNKRGMWR